MCMSKRIKLILSLFILLTLVFGVLFLCNVYRVRHAKVLVDTVDNVEVYSDVRLSDLITSINGKLIVDKVVKTDKIGLVSDYQRLCYLVEYTPDWQEVRKWELYGCWISRITEDAYDHQNSTDQRQISATIQYNKAVLVAAD